MGARRAIIIGAGIGGLAAAHALRRIGWHVTVYEQAPVIAPVGAGVAIAPNAVKALDHLGLGTALRDRGRRQTGLEIRLRGGARVANIPAEGIERRYGAPFYALHRAELHRLLMEGLGPDTFRTGHRAEGVDGTTVSLGTPDGARSDTADLVVAADGVNSRLRAALLPGYPGPTYAGYTVWRGIVPPDRTQRLGLQAVLSETWGRGARFGSATIDERRIYWFAAESLAERSSPTHDLDQLAARFQGWHDPVPALLAVTPPDALLRHDVYYLRARLPGFVHGRVVLLGDAAHAVTPDIGQGACLAIEDAVTLAAAVDEKGIDGGLLVYDAVRRPRTERMARTSGRLGRILQTRSPTGALLRDAIAAALPTPLLTKAVGSALAWTPPFGTHDVHARSGA
ncbi:FAD-dependent monooxygenase [Pseudonocardia sp. DSM 110487]|uniref:FAD-dependent monooxygenase n=1 Tax=Pseudonocardia sp. DSM 110487 TaxID=2865833 RepID=UPI001C69BA2B|nr:FAD-dependent monooxygenase [Pseudonocardia sp. DSM 110487]QYN33100.1 FAD-dependent monooxygenase [Pseudonocardia sp. DSM 110487]